MKYNLKQPLLWLLGALAAMPAAFSAAGLPTLIEPLVQLLGPQGLIGLYTTQTAPLLDSIIVLVLFIGLVQGTPLKKFGKAVPVVMGIVLAIGYAWFEYKTQFYLWQLGPIAVLIIFGGVIFCLYWLLSKVIKNRALAFLLPAETVYHMLPPSVIDWLTAYSGIWPMLELGFSVGAVILVIVAVYEFIKWIGTARESRAGKWLAKGLTRGERNIDDDVNRAVQAQQRAAADREREARERAAETQQRTATEADATRSAQEASEVSDARKALDESSAYLEEAARNLRALQPQPPQVQEEYKRTLSAAKERFHEFVRALGNRLTRVNDLLNNEETKKQDELVEKQMVAEINQHDLKEFDSDKRIDADVESFEKIINDGITSIIRRREDAMAKGIDLSEVRPMIDTFMQAARDNQDYQAQVVATRNDYSAIANMMNELATRKADLLKRIAVRQQTRASGRTIIAEVKKDFEDYTTKTLIALDSLDLSAMDAAADEGKKLGNKMKDVQQGEQNIMALDQGIMQDQQAIIADITAYRTLENEFLQQVRQLLQKSRKFERIASATGLVFDVAMEAANYGINQESKLKKSMKMPMQRSNLQRNLREIDKICNSLFSDVLSQITKDISNDVNERANDPHVQAEAILLSIRKRIRDQWDQFIAAESESNQKTIDLAKQSAPQR